MSKTNSAYLNADFFNNPEEIVFRSISQIIKIVGKKYYPPRGKKIDRLLYLIKNNNSSFKVSLGNCLIKKVCLEQHFHEHRLSESHGQHNDKSAFHDPIQEYVK